MVLGAKGLAGNGIGGETTRVLGAKRPRVKLAPNGQIESNRKTSPRTSTIVLFIFYFWSFEISVNILRNQK